MAKKEEIDNALIEAAEASSPQSKIIRRHFDAIEIALDGGLKLAKVLAILEEKTGVKFGLRWSYEVLQKERKKRAALPAKPARTAKPRRAENQPAEPPPQTSPAERQPQAEQQSQGEPIAEQPEANSESVDAQLTLDDLTRMPIDDLPGAIQQFATAEFDGETFDVRSPEPPYDKFGSNSDQSVFNERMKAQGFEEESEGYVAAFKELRRLGRLRQDYYQKHRTFKARSKAIIE